MKRSTGMTAIAMAVLATASAACSSSSTQAKPMGLTTLPLSGLTSASTPSPGTSTTVRGTQTTVKGAPDPNANEIVPPGDIPDTQVFIPYTPASGQFSVDYPEGWSKRIVGATTVFTDKFNTIEVSESAAATAPTVATARANEVPKLLASVKNFKLFNIDTIARPAGSAVHLFFAAVSGVDDVTGKTILLDVDRYEFFRNGHLVTITLSASKGSDNVDPWAAVTKSFTWK